LDERKGMEELKSKKKGEKGQGNGGTKIKRDEGRRKEGRKGR
jgi:hypothetical protein